MPSQICHALVGRMALESSGVSFPFLSVPAFNLGCQGPDIFSHGRMTKPSAVAFAGMLHRGRYGRFCGTVARLIRESGAERNPDVVSWFLGFVTHQETDRAFHPYIVNRSSTQDATVLPGVSPSLFHAFFERILDVMILKAVDGRSAREFDTGSPFDLPPSRRETIVDLVARSLTETYPDRAIGDDSRERVENAFFDSIGFYRLTNPVITDLRADPSFLDAESLDARGAAGVALLYPCDLDPSVDWLNDKHRPWKNPANGDLRHESALDLFERAVDRSCAIVRLAAEAVLAPGKAVATRPTDVAAFGEAGETRDPPAGERDDASRRLARAIGDSCLSIAGQDGKVAPVVACEPFDLALALANETEKRVRWIESTGNGSPRARLTPENGTGMMDR